MAIQDYLDLIPSQHRQRPKFIGVMTALLQPLCDLDELLAAMPAAFDLDKAVGVQLDQVGEWVGRTRQLRVPLTDVYFTWGDDALGWGKGSWQGKFDPTGGMVSLPDDVFRTLLKAKIAANGWDSSIPGAYAIWEAAFADSGSIILIQDTQNMSMVVGIAAITPDAVTTQLLAQGYIPLKPSGVRVDYYALTPSSDPGANALFAWDSDSEGLAGWGRGNFPQVIYPV